MITLGVYCKHAYTRQFEGVVSKDVYLDACKWLAKHIYNNPELSQEVLVKVIKKKKTKMPTFVVYVYIGNDEEEISKAFCKRCKMLHSIFYSVDGVSCKECRAKAYRNNMQNHVENKAVYLNDLLEVEE